MALVLFGHDLSIIPVQPPPSHYISNGYWYVICINFTWEQMTCRTRINCLHCIHSSSDIHVLIFCMYIIDFCLTAVNQITQIKIKYKNLTKLFPFICVWLWLWREEGLHINFVSSINLVRSSRSILAYTFIWTGYPLVRLRNYCILFSLYYNCVIFI